MNREKELLSKIHVLNQSNRLLEEENKRIRKQRDALENTLSTYRKRLMILKKRGFWARLFNL